MVGLVALRHWVLPAIGLKGVELRRVILQSIRVCERWVDFGQLLRGSFGG